eukprot:COSAG02_NODE_8589_length_2512_cov_3.300870_2_plen_181_part_00
MLVSTVTRQDRTQLAQCQASYQRFLVQPANTSCDKCESWLQRAGIDPVVIAQTSGSYNKGSCHKPINSTNSTNCKYARPNRCPTGAHLTVPQSRFSQDSSTQRKPVFTSEPHYVHGTRSTKIEEAWRGERTEQSRPSSPAIRFTSRTGTLANAGIACSSSFAGSRGGQHGRTHTRLGGGR